MTDRDALERASLVAKIRLACARQFDQDPDYPFFNANYLPGESADDALVRLFNEELEAQRSRGREPGTEYVIDTLIHG